MVLVIVKIELAFSDNTFQNTYIWKKNNEKQQRKAGKHRKDREKEGNQRPRHNICKLCDYILLYLTAFRMYFTVFD